MPSAAPRRSTDLPSPARSDESTVSAEARVLLRWPGEGTAGECDNFFLGAWRPHGTLRVEWGGTPPGCVERRGPNWFLASAPSPLHPRDTGLVHGEAKRPLGVAFRGYVLPHLHSYSPAEEVLAYWAS